MLITLVVVGIAIAVHQLRPPGYTAEAVLVVPAGSSNPTGTALSPSRTAKNSYQGPGLEQQAQALATTFAGLIPDDQAVLQAAGSRLGRSTSYVQSRLSVVTTAMTSIVRIDYKGTSRAGALLGATTIAKAVSGMHPVSPAIPPGALMLVRLPDKTTTAYTLNILIAVGAVLGIALGLLLVAVLERANPRIEAPGDAEERLHVPVIAARRLSGAVVSLLLQEWHDMAARAGRIADEHIASVGLVPASKAAFPAARELAARLSSSGDAPDGEEPEWSGLLPGPGAAPRSALVYQSRPVSVGVLGRDELDGDFDLGEIARHDVLVLVVTRGTSTRRMSQTVDLLAELGRAPDAAILAGRKASELPPS